MSNLQKSPLEPVPIYREDLGVKILFGVDSIIELPAYKLKVKPPAVMLLETIKIHKGVISNPGLHNDRMYQSRKELLGMDKWEDIPSLQGLRNIPFSERIIKVRILYAENISGISWEYYTRKVVRTLKVVVDDEIDYHYKYADRSHLNKLFEKRGNCDDIIIVKNGMLTDSSYSNLAFFDGKRWLTPSTPLLSGTRRRQLTEEGRLVEEELRAGDLRLFRVVSLINSLNDIGEMEVVLSTSCG